MCDKYPNILACDELHDANDKDDELELPKKEIKLEFEKEEIFDERGLCVLMLSAEVSASALNMSAKLGADCAQS